MIKHIDSEFSDNFRILITFLKIFLIQGIKYIFLVKFLNFI